MEFDLLKYSSVVQNVCLKNLTRRQAHDVVRQAFAYPDRIRICPCSANPWVRDTLVFLGASLHNEPSH